MRDLITIGVRGGHVTVGTTEYVEVPIGVAVGAYQSSVTASDARLLARVLDQLADQADLYAEVREHNEKESRGR